MRWICILLFLSSPGWVLSQKEYKDEGIMDVREWIDSLCSDRMAGRGYTFEGHKKAAHYLQEEFHRIGLVKPPGMDSYLQPFGIEINLPTAARIKVDGQNIEVGRKAILNRLSGSGKGEFEIIDEAYGLYPSEEVKGKVAILRDGWPDHLKKDKKGQDTFGKRKQDIYRIISYMEFKPAGIIVIKEKLTAGFAKQALPFPVVEVLGEALPQKPSKVSWEVVSSVHKIQSQNVLGFLPGTDTLDSTLIISAHYDHLGQLEKAIFTGANDNASGVAMLLKLATYFSRNPMRQNILFIAFGGEETGLAGSNYYVNSHPILPLEQISFVLNLDLMGNGEEGITAVAGYENEVYWQKLVDVNSQMKAVPEIKRRRNRPNSDHFFFVEKGIPALFLFTLGGLPHYHDVNDRPEVLSLDHFLSVYDLLLAWLQTL
ncbi:MAG: M28 family peptidase [Bacteroidota bacterium]